jgi:putative CocE/NonD family hydrolase
MRLIDSLRPPSTLVINASTHHGTDEAGELGAPYGGSIPNQVDNISALSDTPPPGEDIAWLNRWVKGIHDGITTKPRVRYLDLGNGTWHAVPTWHAADTKLTDLYLSAQNSGSALLSPNDGTLASRVPHGGGAYQDSYVYNPAAGASVPMGKDGPDGFLPYAPLDQRLDEPQGLTYTTAPLTKPLHLAGPSELRFWAVTEGSDMAWVGRLEDVAPNGSASLITQGWLRASFRAVDPKHSPPGDPYLPDTHSTPVVIGQTTKYRMDIWDTAYTLAPGHRLRLWLSSSDTPTHEPLPVAGRNLIFHDSVYPSRLILGTATPARPCPSGPESCRLPRR